MASEKSADPVKPCSQKCQSAKCAELLFGAYQARLSSLSKVV